MSVNFFSVYSDVFGIPDNVSISCDTPFFIDFDEHGGDEALGLIARLAPAHTGVNAHSPHGR